MAQITFSAECHKESHTPWAVCAFMQSRARLLRWLHPREEHGLADAQAREGHQQAVQPHAGTSGRRHALLHRLQEVLIENHGLIVAARSQASLILETLALDDRVNQLGVAGRQLEAAQVEIP